MGRKRARSSPSLRSRPVSCGELVDDHPCEREAGHLGSHLYIHRPTPEERLTRALADHTRALEEQARALRHEAFIRRARQGRTGVEQVAGAAQSDKRRNRAERRGAWDRFFAESHDRHQDDTERLVVLREKYGLTVTRSALVKQRSHRPRRQSSR